MASAELAFVPTDEEVGRLFAPLVGARGVALAVSGGADSTALTVLFCRWLKRRPDAPPAIVLTVDHGLRPAAAEEALRVADLAARLGLRHRTLVWEGDKPQANLQAEARAARYRLLTGAAIEEGCDTLLVAHHADDQAETFLHNLIRGSGVYGLSGMPAVRRAGPITIRRPLIDMPKARLIAQLRAVGETWSEDPSNADERFERARLRKLQDVLAAEGLSRDRILKTARQMQRAGEALDGAVDRLLGEHLMIDGSGLLVIARAAFRAAPEEIRLRALARMIRHLGDADHTPRLERVEALDRALYEGGDGTVRTLGGTIAVVRRGSITIGLEAGREGLPRLVLAPGEVATWAGAVAVALDPDAPVAVEVGPVGAEGWTRIAASLSQRHDLVPARFLHGLPGAFVDGELVACPAFQYAAPGAEAVADRFHAFLNDTEGLPSTRVSPFADAMAARSEPRGQVAGSEPEPGGE